MHLPFLLMPKIPERDSIGKLCHRCQYFLRSPFLVCAVNPSGPDNLTCEDFAAISEVDVVENKQPLGGGYYAGDWIPQPFPTLTTVEQLAILDWHPQFTGRCPECEMPIANAANSQWHCNHCEWRESATHNA
ncbi:MAG: hypothetical protein DCF15_15505 [Phormidesmis priestleyi]|uniref:Uncharacterized protein n=1 Tax=Phormidesmis priestleyi TaxID=268141 RepID=A0A2W4X072_9CYAN|nr:MAG: hypothetical protein DCF15_15505 [Phormidesmis priestleyi]